MGELHWLLWVGVGLLALNWFGDSLDGSLARARQIERPRYGYYLDHLVDAVSTAAIAIGIGVSPYMMLWLGIGAGLVYMALSINVYLEAQTRGAVPDRLRPRRADRGAHRARRGDRGASRSASTSMCTGSGRRGRRWTSSAWR